MKKNNKKKTKTNTSKKVETTKVESEVVEKKSKRIYLDVLLILFIIIAAMCLHLPSYRYDIVDPAFIDDYEDENGDTYLHDMDSYFYTRKVQEFTEDGIKLKYPRSEDKLRGPISSKDDGVDSFAFPAIVSIIWRVVRVFSKVPFMRFIRFMGPILSALACIPAYIFVKKRTNALGGLAAGFIAATSPAYFGINGFGCFDTDTLLYLLPLIFMCGFIEALQEKDFKKQSMWIGVSILGYLVLSYTWVSHIIYFYLAVGLGLLFMFITLIREKFNFKECLKYSEFKSSGIIIVLLTISTLLVDKSISTSIFGNIINMLKGKDVFLYGTYPDPGKYVSELSSIPLFSGGIRLIFSGAERGIVNRMGGIFIVSAALITLVYFLYNGKRYFIKPNDENKSNYILGIVLALWLFGGLLCLKGGSRFTKIPAIPMSLITGMGMGIFYNKMCKKGIGFSAIFITIAFILFVPSLSALQQARNQNPSSNDALSDISDWIRENTNENAIIISWWDYGYYYEFRGQRTAAADGGTFNGRYYYWLSNIFITTDEHLSSSIAKMLAYSGIEASYLADEYAGSPKKGCEMLKEILVLDKDEAAKVLKDKYHLKDDQIKKLLKYSHADEGREIIIVVTKDMLNKIKPISYYANYDFTDNNNGVSTVDSEFMMYRFYHHYDVEEHYEYLTYIPDNTTLHNGQLWRVK